jgi:hypothetical protein
LEEGRGIAITVGHPQEGRLETQAKL